MPYKNENYLKLYGGSSKILLNGHNYLPVSFHTYQILSLTTGSNEIKSQ